MAYRRGILTKRLIEIDDELLVAARDTAGQETIKGTVTVALQRLVAENRRREQTTRERWEGLGDALADLQAEDLMRRAWS